MNDFQSALPDHGHVEAKGRGKIHGLVVFYRKSRWRVKATRTVHLDDEEIDESPTLKVDDLRVEHEDLDREARRRRGGSRQTKNIGLIVGLENVEGGHGVVIATTHLLALIPFIVMGSFKAQND